MRYQIHQLTLPLDYTQKHISPAIAKKIRCKHIEISYCKVTRRSLDTRNKPKYVATAEFELSEGVRITQSSQISKVEPEELLAKTIGKMKCKGPRPVIVGSGPAGLMAALILAKHGAKPLVFERGSPVDERGSQVQSFWKKGYLNPESNVLYGEGGAGLFSDGKLTSRSKNRSRVTHFLETLVQCGASEDILIDSEPHVGSDTLTRIVPKLRETIIEQGGEFQFNSRVENIIIENGSLEGLVVTGESIDVSTCIFATGHSARDVYRFLSEAGVTLEIKPFAVGIRIELPQHVINRSQYSKCCEHPKRGAASFRLTRKISNYNRACYTFCMCPGGIVIPCASSAGMLTTNGMSYTARNKPFGNAAFLVPVTPGDLAFHKNGGVEFQEKIEQQAFKAGGNDYSLPASRLSDFLNNTPSTTLPGKRSFTRSVPADVRGLLPDFVKETLVYTVPKMLCMFDGLNFNEITVYAAETRSSSPVRITRNDDGMSVNVKGLYPCGEGAGYAGGIVSSAVDAIRIAEYILKERA